MPSVRLSGQNRNIPAHVLNSPKSALEQNNVRFHVDGHYLTDMSDKGIEKFVKKYVNRKSGFLGGIGLGWGGKDLSVKEVKAFIQATAANAEQLQNVTFDLKDPDLGLYDDDDITVKDIQHSLQLDYETTGTSNTSVSFVDVTGVRSDYKQASTNEKTKHDQFKNIQKTHRGLKSKLQAAQKRRDRIANRIGSKSAQRLLETDNKIQQNQGKITELQNAIGNVRSELSSGSAPADREREMRLMLRGMEMELKDLEKTQQNLRSELKEDHGFWSFLGGGSSLDDLRAANAEVEKAQQALYENRKLYDRAHQDWQEAQAQRKAVENGGDWSPQAPSAPPAAEPPSAPAPTDGVTPPTTPATDIPLATEKSLQDLLAMPVDQQVEALNNVPEEQRDLFLKMADDYWIGGQPGNPFGLGEADYAAMQNLQQPVAQLRLNALLSWGEDTQNTYLNSSTERTQKDILSHLNQQLFDQQLAAQAQELKARLAGQADGPTPPADVVPPAAPLTPPPGTPAPDTPQAPAAEETITTSPHPQVQSQPAAPQSSTGIDAQTYAQLSPADKLRALVTLLDQNAPLEEVQTLASQLTEAQRREAIQELEQILEQTQGAPLPQKTAMSSLVGLLKQMTPEAVAPAAPVPQPSAPVAPTPPAPQPAVETPKLVEEPVEPAMEPPAPVAPTPPAPSVEPAPVEPVEPAEPQPSETKTPQEILMALAQEAESGQTLANGDPSYYETFGALSLEDKIRVIQVSPAEAHFDFMWAIRAEEHTEHRQALIASLSSEQNATLENAYTRILPEAEKQDPASVPAIKKIIEELGGQVGTAPTITPAAAPQPFSGSVQAAGTLGATPSIQAEPVQPTAPETPAMGPATQDENKLEMSTVMAELRKELNNKSWMGGLMENSKVNLMVGEIWSKGTSANRQELANLLVNEGHADKLSAVMVNDTDNESFASMASALLVPGFNIQKFMNDAAEENDERAGLVLMQMTELAGQGGEIGQAANRFVMETLKGYKSGIDTEGPIKYAKKLMEQSGTWSEAPANLTKEMKHILDTVWN